MINLSFLLQCWDRVVFNKQWGGFKVFTILRAVEMHKMHENIF